MHVAVLVGAYWAQGGVGTSVREWVARLSNAGFLVSVIAPDVDGNATFGNTRFLRIPDLQFVPQVVFYFLKLVSRHRKQRIDVIHTHDSIAFPAAYLFGLFSKTPNVFTFHASIYSEGREVDYTWLTTRVLKLTNAFVARHADKLVCVSREMMRCAKKAGAQDDRLVLFPNPVDTSIFKPAESRPDNGATCLYVGALRPSKGVEHLIRAARTVGQQVPGLEAVVVGDGPKRRELEMLSEQLGIRSVVHFVGPVSRHQLPEYYNRATVFVMPSLNEPQGIVALEAMACGLPVVASGVGGIPEMVRDQYDGLLVPAGDSEALATAILRVLGDASLRESLAQGALETARAFAWDTNTDRLLSLYRSVAKS